MALIAPTVLVLRALGLGDFLTGLPALRALRAGFPGHRLVLAAPRSLADLVSLAGVADELVDQRGLTAMDWHGNPPELAVNLHGKGPQSHALLRSVAPVRLAAFGCPEAGHRGPQWRPEEHEVTRWCRLVSAALDLPADPADLRLQRPAGPPRWLPGPPRPTAVVHPGAAYPARRWPVDRWSRVARSLEDRGFGVLVTGDQGETALAGEVVRRAGLPPERSTAGRLDLPELARLVADARVLLCGDTGVAHLATAMGTPSVLLFGPTSPQRWGPPSGGLHRVLWHGDGTGDPWADRPDEALLRITVDEVLSSLDDQLADLDAELPSEPLQGPR